MARLSLADLGLLLLLVMVLVLSAEAGILRRRKREWILPPAKLMENTDYTNREFIAKIRSDKDEEVKVEYYLSGPGVDKPPYNLFVVDHATGFVRITDILDREKYPSFNLTGSAKYRDGRTAEYDIPLIITVLDQNDNAPYFELQTGNITEASKEGTFVMQIEGKDNDQAGTINSEISYSIVGQEPEGIGHMFTIDQKTGKLYVKESTLDRETHDFYRLIIEGADLGGAAGGLTGTGTVEIQVLDINDNIPTLEKSEYSGAVDENAADVVVMRIKALDKDLEHTDNWMTVFTIAKGNEDNLFSIETDRDTNEGVLKLIKPVDFEEVQNLELGLLIENIAPFVEGGAVLMDVDVQVGEGGALPSGASAFAGAGASGGAGVNQGVDMGVNAGVTLGVDVEGGGDVGLVVKPGVGPGAGVGPGTKLDPHAVAKSYPIKIAVNNVPEGPAFIPDTKTVPVSEDPDQVPEDGLITVFAAVDPDTGKPAEDVSYAKAYDPDNWFTIHEETAEIKLSKVPDRESPFLVNGTYIAKILAITKDMPSKTATGTIAIEVTDSNDHCPTLSTTHTTLCSDQRTVVVTGCDEDVHPNSAPFTFRVVADGTRGSWVVEVINETSAALHSQKALWPGSYEVQVEVLDDQGLSCPSTEVFTVDVCTCVETEDCSLKAARLGTTSSELSAPAIGLLLLALCLLLFIPLLLLFCQCGGADTIFPDQFSDLPFDVKEHLISYHTEGRGEDKEVPLQSVPVMLSNQKKVETAPAPNINSIPSNITETHRMSTLYNESVQKFQQTRQSLMEADNTYRFSMETFNHGDAAQFSRQRHGFQNTRVLYEDMALPDAFLNDYYSQKAVCAVPVKDSLLEYDFEGQGSCAGSVGCCSLLESDNDVHFLNDLGPKFKTLAEICSPPIPKQSLTRKVADAVQTTVDVAETDVKPKIEQTVETDHTTVKTERVMKSSVSAVGTEHTSMTLSHSRVTNLSPSSALPHPVQTVVVQQQPVYYTTSPVLQPMHYVVQPQLQGTVILADGARTNLPGLYVVSGLQTPSSGLTISGPQHSPSGIVIQSIESPKTPASPTSPVNPTLLLSGSPGVSQGSAPVEGWKIIGSNTDCKYMLVKERSGQHEMEDVDPESPQGTLPRDAILVKEAAPPQGVLGPAAQGSVYGILSEHSVAEQGVVVGVQGNLGQAWGGQPGQMGLGSGTVLGVGVRRRGNGVAMKPEVRLAGMWPAEMDTVGMSQISINQFQGNPSLEQRSDAIGASKACRLDSQKEDKTINVINTFTTTETTSTAEADPPSKEEVVIKDMSDPAQKMPGDTAEDVITFTSEQATAIYDRSELVQSADEVNGDIQEYPTQTVETASNLHLEDSDVKPSAERSDSEVEKPGATIHEIVTNQFNKITDMPTTKSKNMSPTTELADPQEDGEEVKAPQSEWQDHVLSEGLAMMSQRSCTDAVSPEADVIDLVHTDKEKEDRSHGEEATPTADYINTVDVDIQDITEESVCRQEAAPLTEEEERKPVQFSTEEGPEDRRSELPSSEFIEGQSAGQQEEEVSPADFETNQVSTFSDCVQVDNMTTIISDAQEVVKAEQEQLLSAIPSNEISKETVNESEERSIPDQEAGSEQQVSYYEQGDIDKGHADAEVETSFQAVSTILTTSEEGNLISEDITAEVQEEDSHLPTISTLEFMAEDSSSDHKEEEDKQIMTSGSRVDLDRAADSVHDGETEESIVEGRASQQRFTTSDDQDENIDALSVISQREEKLISDDNTTDEEVEDVVEQMVSPAQQYISYSYDQDKESTKEDASHMCFQLDDVLILDDDISVSEAEEETSPVKLNVTASDDRDEELKREDASGRTSPLEHQLQASEIINTGEEEEHIVEEVTSSTKLHFSISKDQNEEIEREDAESVISHVEDQSIPENDISDGVKEEEETSPAQQMTIISDKDEDSEKDVSSTVSQMEDESISDNGVTDGEEEEEEEEEASSIQQRSSISHDQARESKTDDLAEEDQLMISSDNIKDGEEEMDIVTSPSQQNISSHLEEEGTGSQQLSEEESQSAETECSSEEDLHRTIQHTEINQVEPESELADTEEMPCEVTTPQIGTGSSQMVDRHTVGQELLMAANIEGFDQVLISSSRGDTEQVSLSSEDREVGPGILASGQEREGEKIHYNTDVVRDKHQEAVDLTADVSFDLDIKEGLDDSSTTTSGQVPPTFNSDINVVDKATSSVGTDPGSSETGTVSFMATSEVVEEIGYLVQSPEPMTGEAAEASPHNIGQAGSIHILSKEPDYTHGAEAGGGQVSPVHVHTASSQTPQNKSRKGRKDSKKSPRSPSSPSGKCKQQ
ncbi:uncharacterized protein [Trachinotus anak]|uniref:uncharacterized protein n=1 Tax=Trachinotus anak TaxID=443729 RepID=UPI0039F25F66